MRNIFSLKKNWFEYYLRNFYFKNPTDATWSDSFIVGDPSNKYFNGREVIVASPGLKELASFLKKLSLTFEYDHAMGVFK